MAAYVHVRGQLQRSYASCSFADTALGHLQRFTCHCNVLKPMYACLNICLMLLLKFTWQALQVRLVMYSSLFDCFHRPNFWYWESVVLVQTLGLAAAQVFATSLDAFFQLTIMIVILVVGGFALAHFHPFGQEGPQTVQVRHSMQLLISPCWLGKGCLLYVPPALPLQHA